MSEISSTNRNIVDVEKSIETVVNPDEIKRPLDMHDADERATACSRCGDGNHCVERRLRIEKWQDFIHRVYAEIDKAFIARQGMHQEFYEPEIYKAKFDDAVEMWIVGENFDIGMAELKRCLTDDNSGDLKYREIFQLICALDDQRKITVSEFNERTQMHEIKTIQICDTIKKFVNGTCGDTTSIKRGHVMTFSDHECVAVICKSMTELCVKLCGADGAHIASHYTKLLVLSINTCVVRSTFRRHIIMLWKCLKQPNSRGEIKINPNAIIQLMFALFGDTTAPVLFAAASETVARIIPIQQNILSFASMLRATGKLPCDKFAHPLAAGLRTLTCVNAGGDCSEAAFRRTAIKVGESGIGKKCSELK